MTAFDELITRIATRPATFVGRPSLFAVSHYLDGYTYALMDCGQSNPLNGWPTWIFHRFMIRQSAWHWTRVLVHVYGTDAAALEALVPLYAEFARQRETLDINALEVDLRAQLLAKYGREYYEPEVTHTALPW